MKLDGKVAIVTGASRGVGAAAAIALSRVGVSVACAARATDTDPLRLPGTIDDTVRRITDRGGSALAVPTNLAHDGDVERMVSETVEHFGRLDVLVNNAAITFPGDQWSAQVHRHHQLVALERHVEVAGKRDRGVVHENVEPAEVLDGF